jgi:WhiB family redox-sensing transcriptional regulator
MKLPCHKDPELWFPVGRGPTAIHQANQAKAWCQTCPIIAECLDRALQTGSTGVWGGTTEDERRTLIRRGIRSKESNEAHRALNRALASA